MKALTILIFSVIISPCRATQRNSHIPSFGLQSSYIVKYVFFGEHFEREKSVNYRELLEGEHPSGLPFPLDKFQLYLVKVYGHSNNEESGFCVGDLSNYKPGNPFLDSNSFEGDKFICKNNHSQEKEYIKFLVPVSAKNKIEMKRIGSFDVDVIYFYFHAKI